MGLAKNMSEPITASVTATITSGYIMPMIYKILAHLIGPTLATVVVMMMTQPQTAKEWLSAIISTVMCSLGLGSFIVVKHIGIDHIHTWFDMTQVGAIMFMSGLPAWLIVRGLFLFGEKSKDKTLVEMIKEIKSAVFK